MVVERERIARDFHDVAGQTLYTIGLKLQHILCAVTDPVLATQIESVRALASHGVTEMRSAAYALSSLHLRESGFVPSLRALTRHVSRTTGVVAEVRVHGDLPSLPEEIESTLYRAAHEALVNLERHARATGVIISLSVLDRAVELSIRDDGIGLEQREVPDWQSFSYFGMRTVAKSIEAIGGRLTMTPSSPRGIHVCVRVPLKTAHRATS